MNQLCDYCGFATDCPARPAEYTVRIQLMKNGQEVATADWQHLCHEHAVASLAFDWNTKEWK